LPRYQNKYGAGYGPYYASDGYFNLDDINGDGDDFNDTFTEDASYGAHLTQVLVYQWNSIYQLTDTYQKATPWVAGKTIQIQYGYK
jgi:outer membrane usher protein FimD/PapC